MSRGVRRGWRAVAALYAVALVVLIIAGVWGVAAFSALWGVGFGTLAYRKRERFASALRRAHLAGYPALALTVIAVSVTEELVCA